MKKPGCLSLRIFPWSGFFCAHSCGGASCVAPSPLFPKIRADIYKVAQIRMCFVVKTTSEAVLCVSVGGSSGLAVRPVDSDCLHPRRLSGCET